MGQSTGATGAAGWLAAAAPDPEACRREWDRNPPGVALLPAGRLWDVLTVPAALGRPALEVLRRRPTSPGPVLARSADSADSTDMADMADSSLGFLVPPGTTARWIGTGMHGAGDGTLVAVPHPRRSAHGLRWLVAPDGSGRLTDPVALELALHEAAATLAETPDPGRDTRH
ncbi:hypothetical protein [Peterkaempfera bronchialis]|uniref:DNA primase/polymerase bifunctional N-terminal domain-containing protein n=1 Tax=Peterkaempfera bronchialis TaxID=2126346 RepID=A0A345T0Z2_9ACTN|nr:hypothetical protein [Peterkaempfera bronchialis]AXI79647.1 hypothetical protein C7M71_021795 [Peterkaempfera bronchialis]